MKQLNEHHSFTGMQRDISISKQPSSFLYDAHNIRLTARGEDTLLTVTNERGPLYTKLHIEGTYLGHCLIDKYLVIFSTENGSKDTSEGIKATAKKKYVESLIQSSIQPKNASNLPELDMEIETDVSIPWKIGGINDPANKDIKDNWSGDDYITRIDLTNGEYKILYRGNLNFSTEHPIEAIASYENGNIQKVYWTDGYNQPRIINIVGNIKEGIDSQFDFVRELQLKESVTVQKQLGSSGIFAPGVIQYALTYYKKYGQESNIFYTSPLLYISHNDRGASPEDKIENAFKITIYDFDKNFDYIRIYSIQRTSLDATPIVKRVQDININEGFQYTQQEYRYSGDVRPLVYINNDFVEPSINHGGISTLKALTFYQDDGYNLTGGTNSRWPCMGYKKADFPNLVIKVKDGYITWGENSTPESYLWITDNQRTSSGYPGPQEDADSKEGFWVAGTASYSTSRLQLITFSEKEPTNRVSFLDVGTSGEVIDPTELLYKGGESIIAQTIEQKDNTLFLGNITLSRPQIKESDKSAIREAIDIEQDTRKIFPILNSTKDYIYANQLTSYTSPNRNISVPCAGFKHNDYYRCGVQFQYKDGKWSDPIWLEDKAIENKPKEYLVSDGKDGNDKNEHYKIALPTLKGTITEPITAALLDMGYKKARAVVVYPSTQDRVVLMQGVLNPTISIYSHLYSEFDKGPTKNVYSSWFFRPTYKNDAFTNLINGPINPNGAVQPKSGNYVPCTHYDWKTAGKTDDGKMTLDALWEISKLGQTEIEGDFSIVYDGYTNRPSNWLNNDIANSSIFFIDVEGISTLHSPDVEFDEDLWALNYINTQCDIVGYVIANKTFSDIDIQTETPTINNQGNGFCHKSFVEDGPHGIVSGLFYEDSVVNDVGTKFEQLSTIKHPVKWYVYPWQASGSLNNDINRPADAGTRTSVLKKKIISNLRYFNTSYEDIKYNDSSKVPKLEGVPKIFNLDQLGIIKLNDRVYQGNIDTLLVPSEVDGKYFVSRLSGILGMNTIPFNFKSPLYKTFAGEVNNSEKNGILTIKYVDTGKVTSGTEYYYLWFDTELGKLGEKYDQLASKKEGVRMKYKSSPHLVLNFPSRHSNTGESVRPEWSLDLAEIRVPGDNNDSYYRNTMFGGKSEDAFKANVWIPCGEPVILGNASDGSTVFKYEYGDTYYQRWDCLKTYAFTPEDINQVVEIGSFMLETRVNIDGRYDRNRGQVNNLNMSPQNFNLYNPVYSQLNNFFSYRILDEDYYNINSFPNQITWSKEKQAGADVDLWTNITLSSTRDLDGSKGYIESLNTWKDTLYCFQNTGISTILFNSRVQIPTSDGVPIEISNGYKVDGYRYLTDGIGCINKWTISNTPSGIYFIDSVNNHLYNIGESIQDITTTHNMTSWFGSNIDTTEIISTLYDGVNHDLYLLTGKESLCYSEILGQFTSFMDYSNITLLESYNNYVYTMKDSNLYWMFKGNYNDFFGEPKGWDFTFVSNGVDNSTMDFDKTFSTLDYRMDMFDGQDYSPNDSFDYIQLTNEYQDTGEVPLKRLKYTNKPLSYHHKDTNLQKKFRIWRIQVPRHKNSLDRIRNPWCKIKLGCYSDKQLKSVLHDLNVQYFI